MTNQQGAAMPDPGRPQVVTLKLVENGCAQVVLVSLGSHGAPLSTQYASQRFSAIPMRGGAVLERATQSSPQSR